MNDVRVVLPPCSDDPVSEWMRALTERISEVTGDLGGFGLGGMHGYGDNYENDVFMMHRFCWCEQTDCPWCLSCSCGDDWKTNPCARCRDEVTPAPNFLHKATGATVHWYKYIGRGMEISEADWPAIFTECFASLATPPHSAEDGHA